MDFFKFPFRECEKRKELNNLERLLVLAEDIKILAMAHFKFNNLKMSIIKKSSFCCRKKNE